MKNTPEQILARLSDDDLAALPIRAIWLDKVIRWCNKTHTSFHKLETDATRVTGNAGLIRRAEKNGAITLRNMEKIEDYMKRHPDGPPDQI